MDKKKIRAIIGILAVVSVLLFLPPLLQIYYGLDVVKTSFGLIILYSLINYWMKRED